MMMLIFLFLIPLALSQSSVVVLLTPSPYFNHRLVPHANISRYGMRQAYLIGQELQTLYSAKPLARIFSDSSLPSAQTALALAKGIHPAGFGPLVEDRSLQLKAVPPIASHDFAGWAAQMRDQALPHYSALGFASSLVSEKDRFFHAEKNCASIQQILHATKELNCSESEVAKAACKELGGICGMNITRVYNACDCLDTYKSARFHGLTKEVKKDLVDYMEKKCEEHERNLFKDKKVADVRKLLTEKLFDKFEDNLNSTSNFNIYVISELQMKAAVYALTLEFPSNLPKYGSMLVLERSFTSDGSNVSLSLNKQPQKILNSTSIPYGNFVAWINGQRLDDYEYMCTPYPRPSAPPRKWLWIVIGVASGLSLAAVIALIVIIKAMKKKIDDDVPQDDDYYYMSGAPNASLPINESGEPRPGGGARSREAMLNPVALLEEGKNFY